MTTTEPTDCVLQPWVMQMPWKMQSILFSGLRGPDQELLHNIKQISKWLRSVTQQNADPSKPYMNGITLPGSNSADLFKELEHCPCHFVHHFLDALAIVAYKHPEKTVAEYAASVHFNCAEELFHFFPEPATWFLIRHRDKRNGHDPVITDWQNHEEHVKKNYMDGALARFQ